MAFSMTDGTLVKLKMKLCPSFGNPSKHPDLSNILCVCVCVCATASWLVVAYTSVAVWVCTNACLNVRLFCCEILFYTDFIHMRYELLNTKTTNAHIHFVVVCSLSIGSRCGGRVRRRRRSLSSSSVGLATHTEIGNGGEWPEFSRPPKREWRCPIFTG